MDAATGALAVDTVFNLAREHDYSSVLLKYAGGEATLNFARIRQVHDRARNLAQDQGIALQGVILTNGTNLRRDMIDYIRSEQLHLQISLDGLQDVHDQQRPYVSGRGSYERVARTIERVRAAGIDPSITITVTSESAPALAETVQFALEADLQFTISFYRGHEKTMAATVEQKTLLAGMHMAFAEIASQLPRRRLVDGLIDLARFEPHQHSCAAGDSYLVIDHHGGIARCQMEIQSPVTHLGAANPLHVIQLEQTGFQRIAVDTKEGCRTCQWRHWCAGGCPALTYRVTGRNDVQSPYCDVYKSIYPEALRLEGLRLVKWAEHAYQFNAVESHI